MIKLEIKKSVVNIFFLISIVLLYFTFLSGQSGRVLPENIQGPNSQVSVITAIWNKLHGNWSKSLDSYYMTRMQGIWRDNWYLPVLMPVLCGLPSVINYMAEVDTDNKKLILVRCTFRKYYISKFISNIVSSAVIALSAIILYYITLICFYDRLSITDEDFTILYSLYTNIPMEDSISATMFPIYLFIIKNVLYFIFYAVISSSFCFMVAALCRDIYITIGFTVIFCYLQCCIYAQMTRQYISGGIEPAGVIADIINPVFLRNAGKQGFYADKAALAVVIALTIMLFNYGIMLLFTKKQFDTSEH